MDASRDKFEPLSLPEGKIAFVGNVRVDDGGADEFRIELNGKPPLFGEWSHWYHKNETDFDVKIISFGYGTRSNVGNPHPGARFVFSTQEKREVEKLILKIFERELLKLKSGNRESSVLRGRNPSYSGTVIFEDNWLRVREHSIVFALKCAAAAILVAIWISLGALFGRAVAVLLGDRPEPTDPLLFEVLGGVLSIPILIGYVRMRAHSAHKWPKTLMGRTAACVGSGMMIGAVAWGFLKASGYRVPHCSNSLTALALIGALLGFITAKIFRVN